MTTLSDIIKEFARELAPNDPPLMEHEDYLVEAKKVKSFIRQAFETVLGEMELEEKRHRYTSRKFNTMMDYEECQGYNQACAELKSRIDSFLQKGTNDNHKE